MSTISQKLNQVSLDKDAIRIAIESKKGSALTEPNNLGTYAPEIDGLPSGNTIITGEGDLTAWDTGAYSSNTTVTKYLRIYDAEQITVSIDGDIGDDTIKIYNLSGTILLGTYSGSSVHEKILHDDSSVKIVFESNSSFNGSGATVKIDRGDHVIRTGNKCDTLINFVDISAEENKIASFDAITAGLISTGGDSRWESTITTKALDPNWVNIKESKLNFYASNLKLIDSFTTKNIVSMENQVSSGDDILIIDDSNNIFDFTVQSVAFFDHGNGDPFSDNSQKIGCNFNGNILNYSKLATTLLTNNSSSFVEGDSAIEFVSNSYVTTDQTLAFPFSVSVWGKEGVSISNASAANVGNTFSVLSNYNAVDGELTVNSRSRNNNGVGSYRYRNTVISLPNEYYHLVLNVEDGETYSMFINGVAVPLPITATDGGTMGVLGGFLTLGRYNYNGSIYYLDGVASNIEYYDRVLSQSEVSLLFNAGKDGKRYEIDISSLGMISQPTSSYLNPNVENRYSFEPIHREVIDDFPLTISTSSTTSVKFNEETYSMIKVGDEINLDGSICQITGILPTESLSPLRDNSLIAKWDFNESVNDIVGNHNGTIRGSLSYGNSSRLGKEIVFNPISTNNSVDVISNISDFKLQNISFNMMVTFDGASDYHVLINNNTNYGGAGNVYNGGITIAIYLGKTYCRYMFKDSESNTDSNGNITSSYTAIAKGVNILPVGVPFLYTVVLSNGNNIKAYVNGVLEAEVSSTQIVLYPTDKFFNIGVQHYQASYDYGFVGKIDFIEVYNKAISQSEINTLNSTKSLEDSTPSVSEAYPFKDESLMHKWNFDDGTFNNVTSGDPLVLHGSVPFVDTTGGQKAISFSNNQLNFLAPSVDDNTSFPLANSTISIRVKVSVISSSIRTIFSNKFNEGSNGDANNGGFRIYFNNNKIKVDASMLNNENTQDANNNSGTSNVAKMISSFNITEGEYVNVVLTIKDGNKFKLYINGVLDDEMNIVQSIVPSASRPFVVIGATSYNDANQAIRALNGDIEYIGVYNRDLTLDEVSVLNLQNKNNRNTYKFLEKAIAPTTAFVPSRTTLCTNEIKTYSDGLLSYEYKNTSMNSKSIKQIIDIPTVGTKILDGLTSKLCTNEIIVQNASIGTPTITVNDNTTEPTVTVSGELTISNTSDVLKFIDWRVIRTSDSKIMWTKTTPFYKKTTAIDHGLIVDGVEYSFEARLRSDNDTGSWGVILGTPTVANTYVFNMEYGTIGKSLNFNPSFDAISNSPQFFQDILTDGVSLFEMDYTVNGKHINMESSIVESSPFTGDTLVDGSSLFEMDYIAHVV